MRPFCLLFLCLLCLLPVSAAQADCAVVTGNTPVVASECSLKTGDLSITLQSVSPRFETVDLVFNNTDIQKSLENAVITGGTARTVEKQTLLEISLPPEATKTVKIQFVGSQPQAVHIEVQGFSLAVGEYSKQALLFGVSLGGVFLLFAINILIYLSSKQADFFYAALYIACVFTILLGVSGLHSSIIPSVEFEYYRGHYTAYALLYSTFLLYARSFLMIGDFEPASNRFLKVTSALGIPVAALAYLFPDMARLISASYHISSLGVLLIPLAVKIRERYVNAFLFIPVMLIQGLVTVLEFSPWVNAISRLDYTGWVFSVFVVQCLIITFEVVHRFSSIYSQVVNYQEALQLSVEKRTKELQEMARNLEHANRALEQASNTDPLTGLSNRRHFDELAEIVLKDCLRQEMPVSMLVLDADHFKRINDTYGHDVGDQALVHMASVMKEVIKRPMDVLARFGGEEFVILLKDTDLNGALHVGQQIQAKLKESPVEAGQDNVITLTLSIGIATMIPGPETTINKLFRAADSLVYHAKKEGRDRISYHVFGTRIRGTKASVRHV